MLNIYSLPLSLSTQIKESNSVQNEMNNNPWNFAEILDKINLKRIDARILSNQQKNWRLGTETPNDPKNRIDSLKTCHFGTELGKFPQFYWNFLFHIIPR